MRLPWPQPAGYLMKGLEQRSPNSHEEVLPYPDWSRGVGGIDGGDDAGAGNGKTLAWPQAGLPRRGEKESGMAARSSPRRPLQGATLLVASISLSPGTGQCEARGHAAGFLRQVPEPVSGQAAQS